MPAQANPPVASAGGSPAQPEYGRRLMVNLLDERAATEPDREWISVPKTDDPADGWKPITYAQGAKSVNQLAHKIANFTHHSPVEGDFPTIAFIGPNDIRYLVFVLAAVKTGYKALLISPKNSQEGQLNLFELTHCRCICFDESYSTSVQQWLMERDMPAMMQAPLSRWFPDHDVPHFPYNKTFDEAKWDPFFVLHTSGSTGFPKPIVQREGMLALTDKFRSVPTKDGRKWACVEMANQTKKILVPSEFVGPKERTSLGKVSC